jgi:hypothetical protein
MQLNAILHSIATHPVVKAAALTLATEIAERGLFDLVDQTMDRAAYSIAKRIVEQQNQHKEQL